MIRRFKFFIAFSSVLFIFSCKDQPDTYTSFLTPETGGRIASGTPLSMKLVFANGATIDSVSYFIDSAKVGTKTDTTAITTPINELRLGNHTLTAKVYADGNNEEVTSNVIILASKAPIEYSFKIINTFPHDTSSYVEGLEFHDGFLYESTGEKGSSKLLRVNLSTGKPVQEIKLEDIYFGEGLTIVRDKIIQLTYKENVGFVYDKKTFKKLAEFPYPSDREGWGLAFDGDKILNSHGSNVIYYLDKNTYRTIGSLEVYDQNGAVDSINELEYINGRIYANVYQTSGNYANKILIIDPKSGALEATINLIGLNPEKGKEDNADYILNGIAWDKSGKRLFVTGKKWSKLYEIQQVKIEL